MTTFKLSYQKILHPPPKKLFPGTQTLENVKKLIVKKIISLPNQNFQKWPPQKKFMHVTSCNILWWPDNAQRDRVMVAYFNINICILIGIVHLLCVFVLDEAIYQIVVCDGFTNILSSNYIYGRWLHIGANIASSSPFQESRKGSWWITRPPK